MNGTKKNRIREKPTKREGPILKGIVKTQLEVVGVEKALLFTHRFSLHYELTVECSSLK